MKVRVGIVGAGKIAQIHAGSLSKLFNAEITSVTDTDEEAGEIVCAPVRWKIL